jgi:hypothetical protein
MGKDFKISLGNQILYTFISPALGIYNLFQTRSEKLILWGGTFLMAILGSIYVYVKGGDGYTHKTHIEAEYLDMSLFQFFHRLGEILSLQAQRGVVDPYLHVLSFMSGSIFGIPELLHFFAGTVYGIVYFTGIIFLIRDLDYKKAPLILSILLTVFFIYRGITGLNAIRWWTAMWMVFAGLIGFLSTDKRKYLFLTFSAVLVHFSFFGLLLPVVMGLLARKLKKTLLIIWLASFFTAGSYEAIKPYFPDIGVLKSREATLNINPELQENTALSANTRFYRAYGEISFRDYSIPFLTVIVFYFFFKRGSNEWFWSLFAIGAVLYSFGNLMEFSPSVSGRAKAGASVIILGSAIRVFGSQLVSIHAKSSLLILKFLMILFFLSCIPVILFQLSYVISMLSIFTLFLPFLSWFFGDTDFSIREFLGSFF